MDDDAVPRKSVGSPEDNGSVRAATPERVRARTPQRMRVAPIVGHRPLTRVTEREVSAAGGGGGGAGSGYGGRSGRGSEGKQKQMGRRKQRRYNNDHFLGAGPRNWELFSEEVVDNPEFKAATPMTEMMKDDELFESFAKGEASASTAAGADAAGRGRHKGLTRVEAAFLQVQPRIRRVLVGAFRLANRQRAGAAAGGPAVLEGPAAFVETLETFLTCWLDRGDARIADLADYVDSGLCQIEAVALKFKGADFRFKAHGVCQFLGLPAKSTTDDRDGSRVLCIRRPNKRRVIPPADGEKDATLW